ncbi:premelanosome protein b [Brachyhypopomus gauderio]|uniref:premelanosome protein b n=1 Tax=Brachyhypopomus gauderio TaxID=698409 RepID=UPI004043717F
MKILIQIVVLISFSVALPMQVWRRGATPRFIRYHLWNTTLYPVWKQGDPLYRNSWTGGKVKFDVSSDGPTLAGARITFSIDILFPANQEVLPEGQVIWAKNCIVNGTQYHMGEPVYPQYNSVDKQIGVFPDGSPLCKNGGKKPPFVFVWKTCGKYWQVSDGPSSTLTINTEDIPVGFFLMDVVIYHYRSRDKFIPIGYVSTHFCITDQIPFAVTLTQLNDNNEGDQTFVRNRAVAFNVTLHDPSGYLRNSDVTFNWEFGDGSGTVITRELTTTHTYTSVGSFEPRVIVQAAIPDPACGAPSNSPTPATGEQAASKQQFNGSQKTGSSAAGPVEELSAAIETVGAQTDTVTEKHQAPNTEQDCVIYRYGSFATAIQVVEGIESVEIIHMASALSMAELEVKAVDITVSCRGSLPTEVCTMVSDADCLSPGKTICSAVTPSPDCWLVLRHLFNDSGVFCLKVLMTNDVSLAVSSARVNIIIGTCGASGPSRRVLQQASLCLKAGGQVLLSSGAWSTCSPQHTTVRFSHTDWCDQDIVANSVLVYNV